MVIPDHYNSYSILAVDPGINYTGIAIYKLDYSTQQIISIDALTLETSKLIDVSGLDEEFFSASIVKLYKLTSCIDSLINTINPAVVACESPFYNRAFPRAYAVLLSIVNNIRDAVIKYNLNVPFITIEPLLVKKIVGAGYSHGKIEVKDAIGNIDVITNNLIPSLQFLDEHAIDAIAVGYSYIVRHTFLECGLTLKLV